MGDIRENAGLFKQPYWVYRSEIPKLFTDEFDTVFLMWWRYNIGMGLPLSGSWAEQPAHLITYIDMFDSFYKAYQQEQQKWQSQRS